MNDLRRVWPVTRFEGKKGCSGRASGFTVPSSFHAFHHVQDRGDARLR